MSFRTRSFVGNDGSYNLTVSFAVGTNPDIDPVNVNNRVQTALPQLPQAVQVQGLTVLKRSAAILQFINFYRESGKLDPVFITSYATINVLDERRACRASVRRCCSASAIVRCGFGSIRSGYYEPQSHPVRCHKRHPGAERAGPGRPHRRAPGRQRPAVQTEGTLTRPQQFQNIVLRANPDGSVLRIGDVARVEMGAQNEDTETRINGRASVGVAL